MKQIFQYKKIIFSFFGIYFLLNSGIVAQTYTAFSDSESLWKIISYDYNIQPSFIGELYYYKLVNSDTIIQGHTYKKVYKKTDMLSGNIVNYPWYFYAAIRQDTGQRKVFCYLPMHGMDELLYDFSLTLNDTLPNSIINPGSSVEVIDSVDSILGSDGFYRRSYHFSPGNCHSDSKLIEGVGGNWGLFEEFGCPTSGYTALQCYSLSSTPILDFGDCSFPLSSTELAPNTDDDKIRAINGMDNFSIESSVPIVQININTIQGVIVKTIMLNYSSEIYFYTLDLSKFYSGLYIIEIIHKTSISKLKIINNN